MDAFCGGSNPPNAVVISIPLLTVWGALVGGNDLNAAFGNAAVRANINGGAIDFDMHPIIKSHIIKG